MRSVIRHVPTGIELDLARADLGHPDGREILKRHYRQSEKTHPEFNRHAPAFMCLRHHEGTSPGMFLKRIGEQWWAYHYVQSIACAPIRVAAPMSDEHKRQVEYWAQAAQDAGWRVELEASLPTGTRPDALIHGTIDTGVEVQRYAMTASAAVARSRKAQLGNVLDIWFTNRTPAPKWSYRVPSVMELSIPWDVVPPRGSAAAAGLRIIAPVRCRNLSTSMRHRSRVFTGWWPPCAGAG